MSKKKVVLISGAAAGLGKGVAESLVSLGYLVYGGFNSTRPPKNGVRYLNIDVTSNDSCQKAVALIRRKEGKIDILINCAGISPAGETLDFTDKQFEKTLQINTIGPFRLIKEVVPLMGKKRGKIINVTSLNGLFALPHSGIYSASKFALEALGYSLRLELANKNIEVINVAPGAFLKEDQKVGALPKRIGVRERSFIIRTIFPFTPQKKVVSGIVNLIVEERNPPRVMIGSDVRIVYMASKMLPFAIIDKLLNFIWQKRGSLAFRS